MIIWGWGRGGGCGGGVGRRGRVFDRFWLKLKGVGWGGWEGEIFRVR